MTMVRWSIATICLSGLLLWAGWQPETVPSALQWTTVDGKTVRFSDLRDAKAVVFITLSTRCPAVPRYVPRLNALYETYRTAEWRFTVSTPKPTRRWTVSARMPNGWG
jgi:anaerobic selenocysteine-containing dehydrogenase